MGEFPGNLHFLTLSCVLVYSKGELEAFQAFIEENKGVLFYLLPFV